MRSPAAATALFFVLLLTCPVHAAPQPLAAEVGSGDPDLGQALANSRIVSFGFTDANGNGAVDASEPAEPIYLDADASHAVSYGDLRLTPFLRYPSGSAVDVPNRDVGRPLTALSGWFGRDGAAWFVDLDSDGKVSIGDLHLGATAFERVSASNGAIGHKLSSPDTPKGILAPLDVDRNGVRGALEPLYVDSDPDTGGARKVSIGDVRIAPSGLGLDDEASQGDLQKAVAAAIPTAAPAAPAASPSPSSVTAPSTWRTLDWVLVVVGVANLAGLVVVGRLASARHPKNPFQ